MYYFVCVVKEQSPLKVESFGGFFVEINGKSSLNHAQNVIPEVEELSNLSEEELEYPTFSKKTMKNSSLRTHSPGDEKYVVNNSNDNKIPSGKQYSEKPKGYANMKAKTNAYESGKSHNQQFETLKNMAQKAREKYEELQSKRSIY